MNTILVRIFNFINNTFANMRKDTILHAAFSMLLYIVIFNFLHIWSPSYIASSVSFCITLIIGIMKEYVIDKLIRNSFVDVSDLYADLAGTIIGVIIMIPTMF